MVQGALFDRDVSKSVSNTASAMTSFLLAPSPAYTDKEETHAIVSQRRGLTKGGGEIPELFIVFLDALLHRLRIVSDALAIPTDLVTAFADNIKAHTRSILNLRDNDI